MMLETAERRSQTNQLSDIFTVSISGSISSHGNEQIKVKNMSNFKKSPLKWTIRSIPVLPLLMMATVTVSAVIIASLPSEANTLTINPSLSLALFQYSAGTCTTTPVTSISWTAITEGAVTNQTYASAVCLKNTSLSQIIYVGNRGGSAVALTISVGTAPSGLAVDLYTQTGTGSYPLNQAYSPYAYSIPAGSSVVTPTSGGYSVTSWALRLVGTPPAGTTGSFSWTVTINAYTTTTG